MLRERESALVYLITRLFSVLSCVRCFLPSPGREMFVGTRFCFPLPPPFFFFGVSGMLAIDKYLNKKLLLNEIITSSAWAL